MFKIASGLTRLFQKPAAQEASPQAKPLAASLQERSFREYSPEDLAGSGLTQAREEFVTTQPNPEWVAQQKAQNPHFQAPHPTHSRVGVELRTENGYLVREQLIGGDHPRSQVTVQGADHQQVVASGFLNLSRLATHKTFTFYVEGRSQNPSQPQSLEYRPGGVEAREINEGRHQRSAPANLWIGHDDQIIFTKLVGQPDKDRPHPTTMARLSAAGQVELEPGLEHLGVPARLAIEFPLPLDLNAPKKS